MTAHAAIAAVPKTGTPSRTLLQALLVSRIAWIVGSGESPADFDPRGEDGSPVTQVIGYNGLWFWYDEADSTTGHDGVTCIVTTATGGRYKVTGVDLLITSVISKTVTTPPDPDDVDEELRPSDGDAYLVPAASSGAWATWTGSIAVWVAARSEWFRITPKAGWFVSVPGATRDVVYRYDSVQADWITGDGGTPGASTIPLSALIGFGLGPVKVQNQTTYAPPGSRKTGGTPTMPLGGTASNINDNSDATTAVTSALGDLSAAAFADRIVAQIALAAATDLISIEVRSVLGSAVSSANAMGVWYKSAGVWAQAGSGFTLSATAQNIQRNGAFAAVTDIALVTEAKNWAANTNTLAGLNAFDATVTGTVGDAFIIASPAIGILAGHENKVAICEVADTYTIYTPGFGERVFDIALNLDVRWTGLIWESAAGSVVATSGPIITMAVGVSGVDVTNVGPGGVYTWSPTTAPTTATQRHMRDDIGITCTPRKANATQKFTYQFRSATNENLTIALLRDNETSAIAWADLAASGAGVTHNIDFYDLTATAAAHTYKIAIFNKVDTAPTAPSARIFFRQELG